MAYRTTKGGKWVLKHNRMWLFIWTHPDLLYKRPTQQMLLGTSGIEGVQVEPELVRCNSNSNPSEQLGNSLSKCWHVDTPLLLKSSPKYHSTKQFNYSFNTCPPLACRLHGAWGPRFQLALVVLFSLGQATNAAPKLLRLLKTLLERDVAGSVELDYGGHTVGGWVRRKLSRWS